MRRVMLRLRRGIFYFLMVMLLLWSYKRFPYYVQDIALGASAPSGVHWLGTDPLGRDLFSRMIYATGVSLTVGFIATTIAVTFGAGYGILSGYRGGWLDTVMMRWIDIFYPIPLTFIAILLMLLLGQSMGILFLAISSVEWMTTARILRAEVMRLKEKGYVSVARGFGESEGIILWRHIIPNSWRLVKVCFTITLPGVVLTESFLSFIGLGVQAPRSSLGVLISEGSKRMTTSPWEVIFPALVMVGIMYWVVKVGEEGKKLVDNRG